MSYQTPFGQGASGEPRLALEWFDGPTCNPLTDGSLGEAPELLSDDDASWRRFFETLIAPPGARGALVKLRNVKQSGATGFPFHLSFDDVMLVPEPEGAQLAVAAFGAIAFLCRSRLAGHWRRPSSVAARG